MSPRRRHAGIAEQRRDEASAKTTPFNSAVLSTAPLRRPALPRPEWANFPFSGVNVVAFSHHFFNISTC
jgi:hypothetical protein